MRLGRLDANQVAAVAATVAAVAAVAVSVWDNVQQRQFYQISVMPRMEYSPQRQGSAAGSLTLTNEGLGPAIVHSLHIGFCGNGPSSDFTSWNAARGAVERLGLTVTGYDDLREEEVLGQGQTVDWLQLETAGSAPADDPVQRFIDTVAFRIVYTSIYDEMFRLERRSDCLPSEEEPER